MTYWQIRADHGDAVMIFGLDAPDEDSALTLAAQRAFPGAEVSVTPIPPRSQRKLRDLSDEKM